MCLKVVCQHYFSFCYATLEFWSAQSQTDSQTDITKSKSFAVKQNSRLANTRLSWKVTIVLNVKLSAPIQLPEYTLPPARPPHTKLLRRKSEALIHMQYF